jgi:hypothetical protein
MRLFVWLLRVALLALLLHYLFRLFARARGAAAQVPRPRKAQERLGGALVRDPQCGTYIPVSRAIRVGSGDAVHYFCSDGCRAAWASAHAR